jgi:hypothetical protein
VLRVSYRYELPFGVGKPRLNHGVASRVIGGWSIADFISADNGVPITVTSPADFFTYFVGGNGQRPTATGKPSKLDDLQYVDGAPNSNSAAFTRTAPISFGNVSRALSDVRNPGNVNWDVPIETRISITERIARDFRTELYNAINQVIFGGPVTAITSGDFGKIRLNQVNIRARFSSECD